MEHSGGMDVVRAWLNGVSANPVAQLMIIGWAFAFLIEGASGFGTPAALAAPLLVALGFPPVKAALLTLMMNSVPVSFGAVGTPTWFGFAPLGLDEAMLLEIGYRSALLHAVAAVVIPVIALSFLVSWRRIARNAPFIALSILACTLPYVLLARVNYEFPALVGGAIGLLASVWLAHAGIGLERSADGAGPDRSAWPHPAHLLRATFPLWGTVLILVVTRIQPLGLKDLLLAAEPALAVALGALGELRVSAALIFELRGVLGIDGPDGAWSYRTLYVPALIPFFLVSLAAFALYRLEGPVRMRIVGESWQRMRHPILALLGALVLVRLMMSGGEAALVQVIGTRFAATTGEHWPWFAPYLGALGSFFSGSATISNLTFGGIQASIAQTLDLDLATILALQSVGAGLGNMVCINNIVAVCSILGLSNREGYILKRTVGPMILYAVIAAAAATLLFGA
jgi:lactate permease